MYNALPLPELNEMSKMQFEILDDERKQVFSTKTLNLPQIIMIEDMLSGADKKRYGGKVYFHFDTCKQRSTSHINK